MIWGLAALATILVGLPVIAWIATRRLARRPPTPYRGRMDTWIHRQYGLDWADCPPVRTAVAQGSRVTNPALEDAAHRLAAATLSGTAPGTRLVRLMAGIKLVLGAVVAAGGIVGLASGATRVAAGVLLFEGAWFAVHGWIDWAYVVRRQRRKAARALELNQIAHSGT